MAQPVTGLITTLSQGLGLDPAAVLAVARGEGGLVNRPGTQDIGDLAGGGSYGPFQMYAQGALPKRLRGNRAAADAWAWSPAGIQYALTQISKVARGRKGRDAVVNIIRRFERPADPGSSIQAALARLSSGVGQSVGASPGVARTAVASGPQSLSPIVDAIINDGDLLSAISQSTPQTPAGGPVSRSKAPQAPVGAGGAFSPAELFYDPLGGFKLGKQIGAIGGHKDHVHAAFTNAPQMRRAIALAQKLGLRVSENPAVDRVDPVHVRGSYHYRNLGPGLGQAIDVSGSPQKMAAFYRSLAPRRKSS